MRENLSAYPSDCLLSLTNTSPPLKKATSTHALAPLYELLRNQGMEESISVSASIVTDVPFCEFTHPKP